jgi:peptidoglycan DL-endopeptidase CwlO
VLTTALPRRGVAQLTVSVLSAVLAVLFGLPGSALAQDNGDIENEDTGTESLREQLDIAAQEFEDARIALDESEKRELRLIVELEELEKQRGDLVDEIQVVAAAAYRTGRVGAVSALINASSPTTFLERAQAVDMIAKRDAEALQRYDSLTVDIEAQQALIAEEIAVQEETLADREAAKDRAEEALLAVGGGATGEFEAYESPAAEPAPRNEDGSLVSDGCVEDDPTTSGCVTAPMLHAYNEARIFGFTRYTSMYRGGTFGEHPLGRAGDFACSPNGFGGSATGGDLEYCNRLASFFVFNATALGVQYVIWNRQIWQPSTGWRAYGGVDGTPSGNHENHTHLSVLD